MNHCTVSRPAFTVAGIALRTSNAEPEKIGGLWQNFYRQDVNSRVSTKKSGDVYSLYIDYESDHTGPYTLVIGYEVPASSHVPEGLVTKTVPAGKYAVFSATGPQPQTVISIWQYIWTAGLDRNYTGDFDVYSGAADLSQQPVDVFVAIR